MRGDLRTDLRAIWVDGLAWSVMVGMGESYLPAFALALGISDVLAGLVATVPMVAGALLQMLAPRGLRLVGSYRRWIVLCASVQAASFVPLIVAAIVGRMSAPALFLTATLYWLAGLSAAPAWIDWVDTIVPARARIRYFARRTRLLNVFQLIGLVSAGWILDCGERFEYPLYGFAAIFLGATISRSISATCLARQSEPVAPPSEERVVSIPRFLARFRHGRDGRLLVYMLAVQFAVQVSSPFFAALILGPMKCSYLEFMGLLGAAVLGRFVFLPVHGHIAERRGVRSVLWIGGLAIVPSAGLWLLTDDYWLLFSAQLFAGFAWSAYELATFLMLFDSIDKEERSSVLTTYYLADALARCAGSLVGGAAMPHLGAGARPFLALIALSTALRAAAVGLLARIPRAAVDR